MTMSTLDVEMVRAQIRSSDHACGTPEKIATWREDMGEYRANLAIEVMYLDAEDELLFAMMPDYGMSPSAIVEIIRGLYHRSDEVF